MPVLETQVCARAPERRGPDAILIEYTSGLSTLPSDL
jgi:hypothetical protein